MLVLDALTYEAVLLTPPIVIGIVGVPVTVTASDGVTVKSKLTPIPDVPVPLGAVRLTLEIVGTALSIVRAVFAPVKVFVITFNEGSVIVPEIGDTVATRPLSPARVV